MFEILYSFFVRLDTQHLWNPCSLALPHYGIIIKRDHIMNAFFTLKTREYSAKNSVFLIMFYTESVLLMIYTHRCSLLITKEMQKNVSLSNLKSSVV